MGKIDVFLLLEAIGIQAGPPDAGLEEVGVNAAEGIRIYQIVQVGLDQHLFVFVTRKTLGGGDEPGSHVSQIRPHRPGGKTSRPRENGSPIILSKTKY